MTILLSLWKTNSCLFFDFDGTIADTETLHWKAYNQLLRAYDVELNLSDIGKYIGNTEDCIYGMIKEDFAIEFDEKKFVKERLSIYLSLFNETKLKPFTYFNEIINLVSEKGIKLGILSSQKAYIIEAVLKLWEIETLFDTVISVADGLRSKKDILSNVVSYYGYEAKDSALFEDTNKNLSIAKELEIMAIGIEHDFNKGTLVDCDYRFEGEIDG